MVTYLQYLFATDCLHVWGFSRGIVPLLVKQKHWKTVNISLCIFMSRFPFVYYGLLECAGKAVVQLLAIILLLKSIFSFTSGDILGC